MVIAIARVKTILITRPPGRKKDPVQGPIVVAGVGDDLVEEEGSPSHRPFSATSGNI
jgi:hypothetical protein